VIRRAPLVLIVVFTLGTRLAYYASNPHPHTGPWVFGAMAHNIIDDGRWFQINTNAGPEFSFNAPMSPREFAKKGRVVAPNEANLKYADAHPQWEPFIWEPVGEAALLAGLWKVTGSQSYLSDVLMRTALDAVAALLVYRIVILLYRRRRAALAAGLLYALYPPIAEVVVNPNRNFWSLDITIAVLAIYLEANNSERPRRWLVACGVLTGIGLYFEPGALLLLGTLVLALAAVTGWRTALRRALIPTGIAVLLFTPWLIRNYNDFHAFLPTRGLGTVAWQGLAELSSPYGPSRSDYVTYLQVHDARPGIRWLTPEYDSYLGGQATTLIEHHPLFYLKTIAFRVWISTLGELDLEWTRHGTTTPFAYARGPLAYVIEQPFQLVQVMLMPLVFLFAMVALVLTWARYKREHLPLVATVLAIGVPYVIVAVEPRYTMPISIALLIWIALGTDLLADRLRPFWKTNIVSSS
jgi:4-amino-4-deoxy-L-arabinose transferase-like glycosyltransferase